MAKTCKDENLYDQGQPCIPDEVYIQRELGSSVAYSKWESPTDTMYA